MALILLPSGSSVNEGSGECGNGLAQGLGALDLGCAAPLLALCENFQRRPFDCHVGVLKQG